MTRLPQPLPIFELICETGGVPMAERYRVFNMGVGMVLVCARADVEALLASLADRGEKGAKVVGELVASKGAEPQAHVRFPG